MTSAELYQWLMSGNASAVCEQFDAHLVACVLSAAWAGLDGGTSLGESLGLEAQDVSEFVLSSFPHAAAQLVELEAAGPRCVGDDERRLRDLLVASATERSRFQELLGTIVARRAARPSELWQDLGLRNPRELTWLMSRHFEALAAKNVHDLPWKTFLYRSIDRSLPGSCP